MDTNVENRMKLNEITFKKKDYVRCPDGQRHQWRFSGSFGSEAKTDRQVEGRKCESCGLTKRVFTNTGMRVNR